MKRLLSIIICIVIFISTFTLSAFSAADLEVDVSFDANNNLFYFSGHIPNVASATVTVCIDTYSKNPDVFSPDNPPAIIQYYTADSKGFFSGELLISETLDSGRYNAHFYYDNISSARCVHAEDFYFVSSQDTETENIIDQINLCITPAQLADVLSSGEKCEKAGVDYSLKEQYGNRAFEILLGLKTQHFTHLSFYNAFYEGVAATQTEQGINIESIMKEYAQFFGTTYNNYLLIDGVCKKELNSLLKSADFSSRKLADIYADCLLTAQVRASANWPHLRDLVSGNFNESSSYKALPESEKYKVFTKMFSQKNTYHSPSNIQSAFDSAALSAYNEYLAAKQSATESPKSSPSGGTITSDTNILAPIPQSPFADISGHFSQSYVIDLYNRGITNGYPDGTFKPQNTITRAEFSKLAALIFNFDLSVPQKAPYDDVDITDWHAPHIHTLSKSGIIKGYDNLFMPGNNITREDAAVIIYRLLSLCGKAVSGNFTFADSASISDYATDAVHSLASQGILQGDGNGFNPKSVLRRGEAAVLLSKTLNVISE